MTELSYPHIITRLTCDTWAIMPEAYEALCSALEQHMAIRQEHSIVEAQAGPSSLGGSRQPKSMTSSANGIGVVDISGVIGKRLSSLESMCGGVSVDAIVGAVQSLASQKDIGTVVMNWHSPGGVVTGVPEAYEALREVAGDKTLVSYTDSRMCSAAQWLASAADAVYSARTADVGSVGVYNMQIDRSRQLEKQGVTVNPVFAGKYKLMGAPFKPMTSEERGMLQERVDAIHAEFKTAVMRGRPKLDPNSMEGQVLTGEQGVKAGMIDANYPSLAALLKALQR